MNIVRKILKLFVTSDIVRVDQKLQDAMTRVARFDADLCYHRRMYEFYNNRASSTDPYTDWWGFAQAMQNREDHVQDGLVAERRIIEAEAAMKARQAQLDKLVRGEG